MPVSYKLDDDQSKRLQRAKEIGIGPRALAKAVVNDLLKRAANDFDRVAKAVLNKNREPYQRLNLVQLPSTQSYPSKRSTL